MIHVSYVQSSHFPLTMMTLIGLSRYVRCLSYPFILVRGHFQSINGFLLQAACTSSLRCQCTLSRILNDLDITIHNMCLKIILANGFASVQTDYLTYFYSRVCKCGGTRIPHHWFCWLLVMGDTAQKYLEGNSCLFLHPS